MTTSSLAFKRGTTFLMTADVTENGAPLALGDAAFACSLVDVLGNTVASLTAAADQTVTGRIRLTYTGDTTAWPLGSLRADLVITWPDQTVSATQTFGVVVSDRVTSS